MSEKISPQDLHGSFAASLAAHARDNFHVKRHYQDLHGNFAASRSSCS